MHAVTSAMAVVLGSSSSLPGPAVTRDMWDRRGAGVAVHRESFRQLLQEISLIVTPSMGDLLPVDDLGIWLM